MTKFEEAAAKGEITGDDAFELQATDGFPIELTEELARRAWSRREPGGVRAADGAAPGDLRPGRHRL